MTELVNKQRNYPHCKCLQGFTGFPQVCSTISMEKGCKNHRETLYSSKGQIVYIVWKPCNIYTLQGKPYDNYRISLQSVNITGIPFEEYIGFLCDSYCPFPQILQKKPNQYEPGLFGSLTSYKWTFQSTESISFQFH